MEQPLNLNQICEALSNNEKFIASVAEKIVSPASICRTEQKLDLLIQQISNILDQLIEKKLQCQLAGMIQDNNRILEQIKFNFDFNKKEIKLIEGSSSIDGSFTDIHNMINEERRKVTERWNDADCEKSMSLMERCQDVFDKVNEIQKKIRAMEDRYETNFKSLWNVLSMTEAVVFDHIKENKQKNQKKVQQKEIQIQKQPQKENSFLLSFWK